jgi:hypothetical protein
MEAEGVQESMREDLRDRKVVIGATKTCEPWPDPRVQRARMSSNE